MTFTDHRKALKGFIRRSGDRRFPKFSQDKAKTNLGYGAALS